MKRTILVGLTVTLLAASFCWFIGPGLSLDHKGASVVVHVETLGEYPTTIRHIQIRELSSGNVVYELLAESGNPQIDEFKLIAGENPTSIVDPQYGSYRVHEPRGRDSFILQKGIRYRVTVWREMWLPRHTDLLF